MSATGANGRESGVDVDDGEIEERFRQLEHRVQQLEAGGPLQQVPAQAAAKPPPAAAKNDGQASPATSLVDAVVRNKYYQPQDPMAGVYQEAMWFDLTLTLAATASPTRAVKGSLEFCDLFGDPRFLLGYTLNEPLQPGRELVVSGVGFDFNEFMPDHRWVLTTEIADMICRFRVQQVIYADGRTEHIR